PFNDSGSTPSFACVTMPWLGTNDWFALTRYGARGLMYANGVFTYHDIEVAVDPFFAPYQEFLIVGKGSTGNYYYFAPGVYDRPAFTSDTYANVGDDSSTPFTECWFETPEWWAEEGHQVRVQKVIVDYVGWNTGSSANNRIDVQVTSLRPWDTSGVSSSATKTLLDSPGSSFSTSGTTGRAEGLFGDQGFGGGFKVRLSNLRGVAIRAVSVLLAEEARRP
ncbi:MAG: hypothetical protein N2037_10150, partial [Acidimicrobiales bacterium]|nr:hypothetical protein [Acidimicrobiales bacterium]